MTMKVKELIEALSLQDPEAYVEYVGDRMTTPTDVYACCDGTVTIE